MGKPEFFVIVLIKQLEIKIGNHHVDVYDNLSFSLLKLLEDEIKSKNSGKYQEKIGEYHKNTPK